MAKKNQILFKDFRKAVAYYMQRHFAKHNIVLKSGSAVRYEIFSSTSDSVPSKMWVAHKDKYVHKGDF